MKSGRACAGPASARRRFKLGLALTVKCKVVVQGVPPEAMAGLESALNEVLAGLFSWAGEGAVTPQGPCSERSVLEIAGGDLQQAERLGNRKSRWTPGLR